MFINIERVERKFTLEWKEANNKTTLAIACIAVVFVSFQPSGRRARAWGECFSRLAKRKRKRLLRSLHSPWRHTLLKELGSSDEVCVFPEKHRGLSKQVIKLILVRTHTNYRHTSTRLDLYQVSVA